MPTSKSEYEVIKAEDLRHLPPAELLPGTHLVVEGFNVIFGPSGSYKSFYMLDAALNLSQKTGVMYVAAEGISGYQSRVEAWCEHRKLSADRLYFIREEINLMSSAEVTKLVATLRKLKISFQLIILDTYARCMVGGDENSAKDAGVVIRHCATIQRALKTAVAVVHHANRAETGERGSGALRGAADSMIEVSLLDEGLVRVYCSKMKDAPSWPTEFYRFASIAKSGLLIPTDEYSGSSKLSERKVRILDALNMKVFEQSGATISQITDHTGISKAQIYRLLSDLKVEGLIWQEKKGFPVHLSDNGQQSLYAIKPELKNMQINITVDNEVGKKKTELHVVKNK